MKSYTCENCDSKELIRIDSNRMKCSYCNSIYYIEESDGSIFTNKEKHSTISIDDDIQRLLLKCEKEPWNAKKYANRILDIDSTNKEALKYL